MKHRKSQPAIPSIDDAPKLDLNALPPHLVYVFMERDDTLTVIVAPDFSLQHVECLVEVLKRFKRAIGLTVVDIIGNSPGICSNNIKIMPDHKPSIEHLRRLNPPMQQLVKKVIIKWFVVRVIYLIAYSSWVCPD